MDSAGDWVGPAGLFDRKDLTPSETSKSGGINSARRGNSSALVQGVSGTFAPGSLNAIISDSEVCEA